MPLVDRRFFFDYEDGDRLYPQLYPAKADSSRWVFHVSPARNALGHGKEASNLQELKYHVLELGWRMRARSDQGRNGSYARHAGGVRSNGEDMSLPPPDTTTVKAKVRSTTSRTCGYGSGSSPPSRTRRIPPPHRGPLRSGSRPAFPIRIGKRLPARPAPVLSPTQGLL